MNLLTIIVLIIFAISVLHGYRRGFIKSLASLVSIVLSIVLVNIATPYVTDFLKTQTPVYDYILEKCENTFRVATASDGDRETETDAAGGNGEPRRCRGRNRQRREKPNPVQTHPGRAGTLPGRRRGLTI